jgi:hypothetical protein
VNIVFERRQLNPTDDARDIENIVPKFHILASWLLRDDLYITHGRPHSLIQKKTIACRWSCAVRSRSCSSQEPTKFETIVNLKTAKATWPL